MPRTKGAPPSFGSTVRAQTPHGGNGHAPNPEQDRLDRIELLLESLQREVRTQFHRIADLQVQLDRSIAKRQIPPKR
jgi:hypothetical protein